LKSRTNIIVGLLVVLIGTLAVSCGGSRSVADLGARELFEQGLNHYEEDKYRQSSEYFQALVFNYPGNSIVDTAQYYLGLSYFGNEEYELAAIEFNRLAVNYPSSVFFENAVFMKAVAYFEATPDHYGLDQSELERAITLFEDFLIDFPESPLVEDAQTYLLKARTRLDHKLYEAGIVYERIGAPRAAEKYFQKVIDDYTDT